MKAYLIWGLLVAVAGWLGFRLGVASFAHAMLHGRVGFDPINKRFFTPERPASLAVVDEEFR